MFREKYDKALHKSGVIYFQIKIFHIVVVGNSVNTSNTSVYSYGSIPSVIFHVFANYSISLRYSPERNVVGTSMYFALFGTSVICRFSYVASF